jgi:hypothetical protein
VEDERRQQFGPDVYFFAFRTGGAWGAKLTVSAETLGFCLAAAKGKEERLDQVLPPFRSSPPSDVGLHSEIMAGRTHLHLFTAPVGHDVAVDQVISAFR